MHQPYQTPSTPMKKAPPEPLVDYRNQTWAKINQPVSNIIKHHIALLSESESLSQDTEDYANELIAELQTLLKPRKLSGLQKQYDLFLKELRDGVGSIDKNALKEKLKQFIHSNELEGVSYIHIETDHAPVFYVHGFNSHSQLIYGPKKLMSFNALYPSEDLIDWMDMYDIGTIYEIPNYLFSEIYLIFFDLFSELETEIRKSENFKHTLEITVGQHDEELFLLLKTEN